MTRLELWTGEKTYISPIGGIQTPEFIEQKFPATAIREIPFVVETDEDGVVALSEPMNLSQLKSHYKIDSGLSVEQAIAAIEEIINAPQEIGTHYTDETRIADALEDLVVLQMQDMEV